jgi:5'-nucleotidase
MKNRPRILITNDDGIHAPGLFHLWQALAEHCDTVICAPAAEQSGVGLSISIRSPLRVEKVTWQNQADAWSVTGTPADCVKMALYKILKGVPDLIVSGINRGSNAGRNVLYSGTVAGVIEGAMRNIPGVAFSCTDFKTPNFDVAAECVLPIVEYILENPLGAGKILNVNVPLGRDRSPKGFKLTRQGMEYWVEDPNERQHPGEGHTYFWLGNKIARFEEHEDSDIAWLRDGYVTAVPLSVHDLTDHALLHSHKDKFNALKM